ncbi:MAG: hypothetical protein ABIA04_08045 [Pseudomonadota bacterium]
MKSSKKYFFLFIVILNLLIINGLYADREEPSLQAKIKRFISNKMLARIDVWTALNTNNLNVFIATLRSGADVNVTRKVYIIDPRSGTYERNESLLEVLVNNQDTEKLSALLHANAMGFVTLDATKKYDADDLPILIQAAKSSESITMSSIVDELVESYLKKEIELDIDAVDPETGNTAIMEAAQYPNSYVLTSFVDAIRYKGLSVDTNIKNKDDKTLIDLAFESERYDNNDNFEKILYALGDGFLNYDFNTNIYDNGDNFIMRLARFPTFVDEIRLLLVAYQNRQISFDLNLKNNDGDTLSTLLRVYMEESSEYTELQDKFNFLKTLDNSTFITQ